MTHLPHARHSAPARESEAPRQKIASPQKSGSLFFVRDITENVAYITFQNGTQVIQCSRGDVPVLLQRVQRSTAKGVSLDKRIGGDPLPLHGLPKRGVRDRRNHPLSVTSIIFREWGIDYSRYIGYNFAVPFDKSK